MFYRFIRRLLCIVAPLFYRVNVQGRENIPEGAAVVCSNHTALTDPIFAIMTFPKEDHLYIMAKAELGRSFPLGTILRGLDYIPLSRDASDMGAIKRSISLLRNGKKLFLYPEGTRVRPGMTVTPKTGAVMLAYRSKVPVVPIYTTSGNKFPPFRRINFIIGKPYMIECEQKRPPSDFYEVETTKLMDRVFALRPTDEVSS